MSAASLQGSTRATPSHSGAAFAQPTLTALPSTTAPVGHTPPLGSALVDPERYARSIPDDVRSLSVPEQQAAILRALNEQASWSPEALRDVAEIFAGSAWLSFGNPELSAPPLDRQECRTRRSRAKLRRGDTACGAPNMVRLFDPDDPRTARGERLCIDQFEFPNLPCEYPVVWVRASEAQALCKALGKRLCDAHEWEGACAGELLPVQSEYPWSTMPGSVKNSPRRAQRLWLEYEHNRTRQVRWAYGATAAPDTCATGATKDPRCNIVDWGTCGTKSYPAGAFPECVSRFGVYDQHGNAAEHMNLPLGPDELTSRGGSGWTEMKGSWFISKSQPTHPDDCRWRAKSWHTTRIKDSQSHRNYHLGFRCCKSLPGAE